MDGVFIVALALEAIPIGLITVSDRPVRRSARWRHDRAFNCCERCHRPLAVDRRAKWRLTGTCTRCGRLQEWAAPRPGGPAPPVEPWEPLTPEERGKRMRPRAIPPRPIRIPAPARPGPRRLDPLARPPLGPPPGLIVLPGAGKSAPSRGLPPAGSPARRVPGPGTPVRATPVRGVPSPPPATRRPAAARGLPPGTPASPPATPGRHPSIQSPAPATPSAPATTPAAVPPAARERPRRLRTPGEPMPVDPFTRDPADWTKRMEEVKGMRVHRPRPERVRGFRERRREGALKRAASLGQKGFNCCEECGDPLPREREREWRYAGTCPNCGHVQIWAE